MDMSEIFQLMKLELPCYPGDGPGANVYLWTREGELISERHSSVHHDRLTGLNIRDLFGAGEALEKGWELALSGETYAWVSKTGSIHVINAFVPLRSMEGLEPTMILGFCTLLSGAAADWLKGWGVPII